MKDTRRQFKEEMQKNIIPLVAEMITKEECHRSYLLCHGAPKEMIQRSTAMLEHYKLRHQEYIEYADKL